MSGTCPCGGRPDPGVCDGSNGCPWPENGSHCRCAHPAAAVSGDDGLLYPLGQRCCGAANMSDCHQYGLCLAVGIHPELAALRAKADGADRVRELHQPTSASDGSPIECAECSAEASVAWPCLTLDALDGPPC